MESINFLLQYSVKNLNFDVSQTTNDRTRLISLYTLLFTVQIQNTNGSFPWNKGRLISACSHLTGFEEKTIKLNDEKKVLHTLSSLTRMKITMRNIYPPQNSAYLKIHYERRKYLEVHQRDDTTTNTHTIGRFRFALHLVHI